MSRYKSTLKTLKAGDKVRLDGLTVIEVVQVGSPLLKASISAQALEPDGEVSIFDNELEDWKPVADPAHFAVGLGDRLMVGKIQILVSAYSNKYSEVRMSMRTTDPKTAKLLAELKGR